MRRVPMTLQMPNLRSVAEDDAEQVVGHVSSNSRGLSRATSASTIQASIPGLDTMPPANTRKHEPAKRKGAATGKSSAGRGFVLHGDVAALALAFVATQRRLVSVSVPDSLYLKLQAYPGGVSQFYEDAVAKFDGDLRALVEAAVQFVDNRRLRAPEDPARNASGRVLPHTYETIRKIEVALVSVRGMSRAKVLAGLIQLRLIQPNT